MSAKVDNQHLGEKLRLRLDWVCRQARPLRILDCFAGRGRIWSAIRQTAAAPLEVLAIEARKGIHPTALVGDNRKILPTLDLQTFDAIDLDDYGHPTWQIKHILSRGYRGTMFVTMCSAFVGGLDRELCAHYAIPMQVRALAPALFATRKAERVLGLFADHGICRATGYRFGSATVYQYYLRLDLSTQRSPPNAHSL